MIGHDGQFKEGNSFASHPAPHGFSFSCMSKRPRMGFGPCLWLVPPMKHVWNRIIAEHGLGPVHRAHVTVRRNTKETDYHGSRMATVPLVRGRPLLLSSSTGIDAWGDDMYFHAIELGVEVAGLVLPSHDCAHVSLAYRVGPLASCFKEAEVDRIKNLVLKYKAEGSIRCDDMALEIWDASDKDVGAWHPISA